MSWGEVKKINSDMTTPINIANLINHIDIVGDRYIGRTDMSLSMELCKADMLYHHPIASTVVGRDALSTEEKFGTLGFVWLCKAAGVSPASYSDVEDLIDDDTAMAQIASNETYCDIATSSLIFEDIFHSAHPLASAAWSKINGIAPLYRIGEEKNIVVSGETITLQLWDRHHDLLTGGGGAKAKATFGTKHLMATTRRMNASNTNIGGWGATELRTSMNGTIYNGLPSELKDVIKSVDRLTSAGNQLATIVTNSDKLAPPSEIEVFGTITHSKPGEGKMYKIFKDEANRIKKLSNGSGAATGWWLSSPIGSNATFFCFVNNAGAASGNNASVAFGVAWGFGL